MDTNAKRLIEEVIEYIAGLDVAVSTLEKAKTDNRVFKVGLDDYSNVPVFQLRSVKNLDNEMSISQAAAYVTAVIAFLKNKPRILTLLGPNRSGKSVLVKFLPFIYTITNIANLNSAPSIKNVREKVTIKNNELVEDTTAQTVDTGALVVSDALALEKTLAGFFADVILGRQYFEKEQEIDFIIDKTRVFRKSQDIVLLASEKKFNHLKQVFIDMFADYSTSYKELSGLNGIYHNILNYLKTHGDILAEGNGEQYEEIVSELQNLIKKLGTRVLKMKDINISEQDVNIFDIIDLLDIKNINLDDYGQIAYRIYSEAIKHVIASIHNTFDTFAYSHLRATVAPQLTGNLSIQKETIFTRLANGTYKTVDPMSVFVLYINKATSVAAFYIAREEMGISTIALEEPNTVESRVLKPVTAVYSLMLMANADSTQKDVKELPTNVLDLIGVMKSKTTSPVDVLGMYADMIIERLESDPIFLAKWQEIGDKYYPLLPALIVDTVVNVYSHFASEKVAFISKQKEISRSIKGLNAYWAETAEALYSDGTKNVRKMWRDVTFAIKMAVANALLKQEVINNREQFEQKIIEKIKEYAPAEVQDVILVMALPILMSTKFYDALIKMYTHAPVYNDIDKITEIENKILKKATESYITLMSTISKGKEYLDIHNTMGVGKVYTYIGNKIFDRAEKMLSYVLTADPKEIYKKLSQRNNLFYVSLPETTFTNDLIKRRQQVQKLNKKHLLQYFEKIHDHKITLSIAEKAYLQLWKYAVMLSVEEEKEHLKQHLTEIVGENVEYYLSPELQDRIVASLLSTARKEGTFNRANKHAQDIYKHLPDIEKDNISALIFKYTGIKLPASVLDDIFKNGMSFSEIIDEYYSDIDANTKRQLMEALFVYNGFLAIKTHPDTIVANTLLMHAVFRYLYEHLGRTKNTIKWHIEFKYPLIWSELYFADMTLKVNGNDSLKEWFDTHLQTKDGKMLKEIFNAQQIINENQQIGRMLLHYATAGDVDGVTYATYLLLADADHYKDYLDMFAEKWAQKLITGQIDINVARHFIKQTWEEILKVFVLIDATSSEKFIPHLAPNSHFFTGLGSIQTGLNTQLFTDPKHEVIRVQMTGNTYNQVMTENTISATNSGEQMAQEPVIPQTSEGDNNTNQDSSKTPYEAPHSSNIDENRQSEKTLAQGTQSSISTQTNNTSDDTNINNSANTMSTPEQERVETRPRRRGFGFRRR